MPSIPAEIYDDLKRIADEAGGLIDGYWFIHGKCGCLEGAALVRDGITPEVGEASPIEEFRPNSPTIKILLDNDITWNNHDEAISSIRRRHLGNPRVHAPEDYFDRRWPFDEVMAEMGVTRGE